MTARAYTSVAAVTADYADANPPYGLFPHLAELVIGRRRFADPLAHAGYSLSYWRATRYGCVVEPSGLRVEHANENFPRSSFMNLIGSRTTLVLNVCALVVASVMGADIYSVLWLWSTFRSSSRPLFSPICSRLCNVDRQKSNILLLFPVSLYSGRHPHGSWS